MNKPLFTEPELYLLNNWPTVHSLEISVKTLRGKYEELFERILKAVASKYSGLDICFNRITNHGNACVAKSSWYSPIPSTPSGFWIDRVGLNHFLTEEPHPATASVWIRPPNGMTVEETKERLSQAAKRLMTKHEFKPFTVESGPKNASLWYSLPEKRQELLDMLLKNGSQGFVDCITGHFDSLARFTKALDDIYSKGRTRK